MLSHPYKNEILIHCLKNWKTKNKPQKRGSHTAQNLRNPWSGTSSHILVKKNNPALLFNWWGRRGRTAGPARPWLLRGGATGRGRAPHLLRRLARSHWRRRGRLNIVVVLRICASHIGGADVGGGSVIGAVCRGGGGGDTVAVYNCQPGIILCSADRAET